MARPALGGKRVSRPRVGSSARATPAASRGGVASLLQFDGVLESGWQAPPDGLSTEAPQTFAGLADLPRSQLPGVREPTETAEGQWTLRGVLVRFVYQNTDKGFGIAVLRPEQSDVTWTVKGPLWGLEAGESVQVWGKVEQDPKYGKQFRVEAARPVLPVTVEGVLQYLKSARIPGIGQVLARRIVEVLGPHALDRVRAEPEVLESIPGLTRARRKAVRDALVAQADAEAMRIFLYDQGLGPVLASRVLERYGADTVRKIRENPHRLAGEVTGIGFRTADRIAQGLGVPVDAPRRLQAGVRFALQDLATNGHSAPPEAMLAARAAAILEVDEALLPAAIDALIQSGLLVRPEVVSEVPLVALPEIAVAEADLARRVIGRLSRAGADAMPAPEHRVALAEAALGFSLQGAQREAVRAALQRRLLVVTGGPGTGKTTIIRGFLAALAPDGLRVALAAPTGRAARRLGDATGHEAKTLHRLLEFDPSQQRFLRDADRPLDADAVIIDEVSMMDVPLAAALFAAVPQDARVLLVGDADQLPSVGPGAVLDDLLRSAAVPFVALDHIYRQGEGSHIVTNAHRVRHGQLPVGAQRGEDGDFFVIAREEPDEIRATLLEVVTRRLPDRYGFDPVDDVQVLTPTRRGALGTVELNELLRDALNPHGAQLQGGFRSGDKVLQVHNDYDLEVFNGDIGRVLGPGPELPAGGPTLLVRFGDRDVPYPAKSLDQLTLAYAITVHKAQGSEYPAVVVPLHGQHHLLLQRNLLYTALTRGRRFVVLIGPPSALARATRNDSPIRRFTMLGMALRALAGDE